MNLNDIDSVFRENDIEAVVHLAGYKSVAESNRNSLRYYYNNMVGTINLCEIMQKYKVKKMLFSSSATVYRPSKEGIFSENSPTGSPNPYGRTKLMIEQMLHDLYLSNNEWSIALLRYFNPVGAHPSGKLGEIPRGVPNNLVPYIIKVLLKELPFINIFSNYYETRDGTGIRDYVHVVDLALGHVSALKKISSMTGIETYNLGTGKGYSVLEITCI